MKRMMIQMRVAAVFAFALAAVSAAAESSMRLGCQMWGVKEFWERNPEKGFEEVFPKLRAMGYEGVQSMAFWKIDQDRLESLLKANGLALTVDVGGLTPGTYELAPQVDAEAYPDLTLEPEALRVTIRAAEEAE